VALVVDPSELDDLKRLLSARADVVDGLGSDLLRRVSSASWSGPAAEQYRASLGDLQRKLAADADRLRATAAGLARLSTALSDELDRLRGVEAKVRAWFAAHPPGTLPPPWPEAALPVTGDAQWRDVERAFESHGLL
jgi:hypothetical protein